MFNPILAKPETEVCIDLHGMSLEKAKEFVFEKIREFHSKKIYKTTIITGRGAHIAKDGVRGKIFKGLPVWLKSEEVSGLVKDVRQHSGYYTVHLLPSKQLHFERETKLRAVDDLMHRVIGIKDLQSRSTVKDIEAMGVLGLLHLRGLGGVERDDQRGMSLIRAAAEGGDVQSQLLLGDAYTNGEHGTKINPKKAIFWLEKVIESKSEFSVMAHFRLGCVQILGVGAIRDDKRGLEHLNLAADAGHGMAQLNLALIYAGEGSDVGLPTDDVLANTFFLKAAMQNITEAQVKLAQRCQSGTGMKRKRLDTAYHWYERAASLGDLESIFIIGEAYEYGKAGYKKDRNKAVEVYLKSAGRGHTRSQSKVAALLLLTEEPNATEGMRWLLESGDVDAMFIMAMLQQQGMAGIEKNPKESLLRIQIAATLGSPLAIKYNYRFLSNRANIDHHLDDMSTIAEAGDIEAQLLIADLLEKTGYQSEADKWYIKLAEQGIERPIIKRKDDVPITPAFKVQKAKDREDGSTKNFGGFRSGFLLASVGVVATAYAINRGYF